MELQANNLDAVDTITALYSAVHKFDIAYNNIDNELCDAKTKTFLKDATKKQVETLIYLAYEIAISNGKTVNYVTRLFSDVQNFREFLV